MARSRNPRSSRTPAPGRRRPPPEEPPDTPEDAPEPPRGPVRAAASAARGAYRGILAVGALIGVAAGALQLMDTLERRGEEPTPARIAPRILAVRTQPAQQPLAEYLDATSQPTRSFTREQLDQPGYVLDVTMRIIGQVGQRYQLAWAMYRRRDGVETRVEGRAYSQVAADVVPKAAEHETTHPVWVPRPPASGAYVVRFTLLDPRGVRVDRRDSRVVRHVTRAEAGAAVRDRSVASADPQD